MCELPCGIIPHAKTFAEKKEVSCSRTDRGAGIFKQNLGASYTWSRDINTFRVKNIQ
jgi:hypothetical protein